jgi:transposase InsO family protein
MCRYLNISRSSYYDWQHRGLSLRRQTEEKLKQRIQAIFQKSRGRYGSPMIHQELHHQGIRCGRKRVERLMREMGLRARKRRQFKITTDSNHRCPVAGNILNRQFAVEAPNTVWASDITYIRTYEGWMYLAVTLDLYSRRVVGWSMMDTMPSTLAVAALKMAIQSRRPAPGLIHHSDRGVQYASQDFQSVLSKHHMICSMSRKGNCWDNAPAESFFSTLKTELIGDRIFLSRFQARREIFEYIEVYYNRQRLHSTIGYMTPEFFENRRKCA